MPTTKTDTPTEVVADLPAAVPAAPVSELPTPVADAIKTDGGENYVVDQMADTLERARIAAQGRTDDVSIAWGAEQVEVAGEEGENNVWASRFFVKRGADTTHGLTVDGAKLLLDQMGDA